VAIEWLLADGSLNAIAIERRPDRTARLTRNAAAFGVPHLQVIEGAAPVALQGLKTPDAIFIGGEIHDARDFGICAEGVATRRETRR